MTSAFLSLQLQYLSLHQIPNLGVGQFPFFTDSAVKMGAHSLRRCMVRQRSDGPEHWNARIRSTEKCRILCKFNVTVHSGVMNTLTSVVSVPYLLNMSNNTALPSTVKINHWF